MIRCLFGFLVAGIAAPPVSVTIYFLLTRVVGEGSHPRLPIGPDLPMVYLFASLMGTIPSLIFGGLTLLAMKGSTRPLPSHSWVLSAGGLVAATLYCVVFTLLGIAPWGPRPDEDPQGTALMAISIVLSGAAAGLIYAGFVKRG